MLRFILPNRKYPTGSSSRGKISGCHSSTYRKAVRMTCQVSCWNHCSKRVRTTNTQRIEYEVLKLKPVESAIDVDSFRTQPLRVSEDEGGAYGVNVGAAYENARNRLWWFPLTGATRRRWPDGSHRAWTDRQALLKVWARTTWTTWYWWWKRRAGVLENRGNAH